MTEIRSKSDKELTNLLTATRQELAQAVIDMRTKQVKNVRGIRGLKKSVARLVTEANLRQQRSLSESNASATETKEVANG